MFRIKDRVVMMDEVAFHQEGEVFVMGTSARTQGGEVIVYGGYETVLYSKKSLSADYLMDIRKIEGLKARLKAIKKRCLEIDGSVGNNFRDEYLQCTLGALTSGQGVSVSFKATLINS
ncbi:excinuclease ABC subunit UvrA, partial [Francisella tularensis]|nr:excinuclease ABC subunit UvrA [Francisella tularensis]